MALQRAAAHSRRAGGGPVESAALADRIAWEQHDFTQWVPPAGGFDLVSAQFMHLPSAVRTPLFRALAEAVAPGGTLLIVGHDVSDTHHQGHTPPADLFFTATEVAATLDPHLWRVDVAESRPRAATDPARSMVTARDAVLSARRR